MTEKLLSYCWFASDVTAAMLVVKNKSISLRWEMNSILMQILQKNFFCIDHQHGRLVTWLQTKNYKVKGFSSLLVCFAFIFCRLVTFIRYIGVDFTYGVLDFVHYIEDFVISRFCFMFYCNFGRAEENLLLYRGFRYIEVR